MNRATTAQFYTKIGTLLYRIRHLIVSVERALTHCFAFRLEATGRILVGLGARLIGLGARLVVGLFVPTSKRQEDECEKGEKRDEFSVLH
jgi:hypothetical protein